ncbi:MAG: DegQ family serine endoprotease [Myxococcota bacterium]|nr:DegQ family serine endoprotease [Myxococcota bacterium]
MSRLSRKKWLKTGLAVGIIGLVAALACGAAPAKEKAKAKTNEKKGAGLLTPKTYDPRVSLAPLVEAVSPAVVNIRTSAKARRMPGVFGPNDLFEWFFGPRSPGRRPGPRPNNDRMQRSLGSGFIIDAKGLVVTNHHVIAGADEIEIQLADDRTFKAEVVGSDERTDLALLRLPDAKHLPTVPMGDSTALRVGDHVVAIGNPFGLDHTVTSGIVSAKERIIGPGVYEDFIQTDASINPGNSGGPLFNLAGEVVGINTAIAPQGQGIGFAIPSNLATGIIDSLSASGKVVRGWLGIVFQEADEDLAKAFKTNNKGGAIVSNVTPGSPAEKGGIRSGDIIIAINGKKLKQARRQLPVLVAGLKPDKTATVSVIRDGKTRHLKIKIGTMPGEDALASDETKGEQVKTRLGFVVEDLDDQTKRQLNAEKIQGVVVTRVEPDSNAAKVLQRGYVIVEVNRERVSNVAEFVAKTRKVRGGDDLLLLVYVRGGWQYVTFRL